MRRTASNKRGLSPMRVGANGRATAGTSRMYLCSGWFVLDDGSIQLSVSWLITMPLRGVLLMQTPSSLCIFPSVCLFPSGETQCLHDAVAVRKTQTRPSCVVPFRCDLTDSCVGGRSRMCVWRGRWSVLRAFRGLTRWVTTGALLRSGTAREPASPPPCSAPWRYPASSGRNLTVASCHWLPQLRIVAQPLSIASVWTQRKREKSSEHSTHISLPLFICLWSLWSNDW